MAESLRLATSLAAPVMPGIADQVAALLGHERAASWAEELQWSAVLAGNTLAEPTILFPRTDTRKSGG